MMVASVRVSKVTSIRHRRTRDVIVSAVRDASRGVSSFSRTICTNQKNSSTLREEQRGHEQEQRTLEKEAGALTRSLYRACIRSVRVIREGNENDEKEFVDRERKRLAQPSPSSDVRLSMLSMLPPVDREDELRSRAEYYMQYARELFVQESDSLSFTTEWTEHHIARYLHHLRRGDEHRRWLLDDMKFHDPFRDSFDHRRVDKFENDALSFVSRTQKVTDSASSNNLQDHTDVEEADPFDDDSDDEDDSPGLPSWYKNPRSQ